LIAGDNGSAYTRLTLGANVPFVRQNPSGAYDFTAVDANAGGAWLAGQFGQIYHRPPQAPAGPFITFAPGRADFGVVAVNGEKVIEVEVSNRGFAPLNVSNITLSGSSAFSVSTTRLLNIGTNSAAAFRITYRPVTQGDHSATIEFTHNESAVRYQLPVAGRAQLNTWNLIANPSGAALRDVQFVSDTTGFAISARNVLRSTDSGATWTTLSASTPGNLNRLHFFNESLGFAFGGGLGLFQTCTGACTSFILRTDNGGTTWSSRATTVSTSVEDLHMVSSTTGFAVTSSRGLSVLDRVAGDVLRTTDGGLTWAVRTRPTPASGIFSGQSVHAVSASTVFVGGGNGQLFRSTDGGATWTAVLNVATSIQDIQFLDANNGWIVGLNGLFRRTTTGGATSTAWPGLAQFTQANLRRVHFINLNTGWVAGEDTQNGYIFRTDSGGTSWFNELNLLTSTASQAPQSVSGRSGTLAFAVAGQGLYRGSPFAAVSLASPALARLRDFGVISYGSSVTVNIPVRNIGAAALPVSNIRIEDDSDQDNFIRAGAASFTVAAGGSINIPVRYTPRSLGRHHARMTLLDANGKALAVCDLVGEAEVFPTSVTFETQPLGLPLVIDDRSITGRVGFTVVGESKVPNDVINPFHWRFGTLHNVRAPLTHVRDGYEYQFQRWEPSREAAFTLLATNVPAAYRAIYLPVRLVRTNQAGAIAGFSSLERQSSLRALAAGPADVPGGPYIRISQASLQIPGMGTAPVQGSAFLSGSTFEMTLDTSALGDRKLMAIDAGSWRLSYTNNVRFVLRAQNPGLVLLDKPVTGSSQVLLDISAPRIVAQLSTTGPTPVVPSVVELGPSSIFFTNAVSGQTRFSSLRANGTLQLLRRPDNTFAVTRAFNFFASDGPFTNTISSLPNPILNTPLAAITPAAGSNIEVRRNAAGIYGVSMRNINFSLLGGPATAVTAELDQTKFQLTLGRTISFGQLVYTADNNSSFEWRFLDPALRASVSAGSLAVPLVSQSLRFNGFTLDTSADFDVKLALPALTFDGISVSSGGPVAHNYIRLFRESGVTKFQFRDRRSFFDNTFRLQIDVSSAGTASGFFSGNLVVRDFFGCPEIGVGDITLAYNNALTDYQFQGNVRLETCVFGTHDFRAKFGRAGARFCHLVCSNNTCTEDLCIP